MAHAESQPQGDPGRFFENDGKIWEVRRVGRGRNPFGLIPGNYTVSQVIRGPEGSMDRIGPKPEPKFAPNAHTAVYIAMRSRRKR